MLKLDRLSTTLKIINSDGTPTTTFMIYWQRVLNQIESSVNGIEAALEAAGIALAAADNANMAAAAATTAADNAQASTAANAKEQALINSYITPSSVLTATTTTISIASHTRNYADGTSVSVSGGSIGTTAAGDVDYVFYDDPTYAGGSVTYQVSTTQPVQSMGRHVVGAVTIPATGTASGGRGPRAPGTVEP